MREIDITKQDIRCCDDFYVEYDCLNIPYELWFDVDKYFGTNTRDNNAWINFYTYYYADGTIKATYEIDYDNTDTETFDWELTEVEQAFFRGMMETYCHCKYNCSIAQLLVEVD